MKDLQSMGPLTPSNDEPITSGSGSPESANFTPPPPIPGGISAAEDIAAEAGQRLARDFFHLDRRGRQRIVTIFRRQLFPARKRGRKRSKEITTAHTDWKSGIRGEELCRRHIPGFDRMSRWRRESVSRDLMDAIRSRERRAVTQETRLKDVNAMR